MEIMGILRVIRRWAWVILSLLVVTVVALGFKLKTTEPAYEGQVKVQLTAPASATVPLDNTYRSTTLRDDLLVARNNFIEVLNSREVFSQTRSQLHLDGADAKYTLNINALRDSDYLYVTVRSRTPKLAEDIANTHVNNARTYYGSISAQATTATGNFLAQKLPTTEKLMKDAEEALADFQNQNNISTLDSELSMTRSVLGQLESQRSQALVDGKPTDALDKVIASRRQELKRLDALQPVYSVLDEKANQERAEYQLLLTKLAEAGLKEDNVRAANSVQIVEPALAPTEPAPANFMSLAIIAIVGSLGLGIMLAFLLESLTSQKPAALRARVSTWPTRQT